MATPCNNISSFIGIKIMDNHKIEVTGISEPLLKLIDERIRHQGSDRSAYIRDLIERDIWGTSSTKKDTLIKNDAKCPFDPKQWEADMKLLAQLAEQIPVLPPEAFTRDSIYGNHD
ncbi:MAG: ribbon-helix-helix domain-containing protein [Nostoc sp. LLA-1]|nr:ribbon-helix-helix domain-containing protein [Cyanocohniella sp. LLY]